MESPVQRLTAAGRLTAWHEKKRQVEQLPWHSYLQQPIQLLATIHCITHTTSQHYLLHQRPQDLRYFAHALGFFNQGHPESKWIDQPWTLMT